MSGFFQANSEFDPAVARAKDVADFAGQVWRRGVNVPDFSGSIFPGGTPNREGLVDYASVPPSRPKPAIKQAAAQQPEPSNSELQAQHLENPAANRGFSSPQQWNERIVGSGQTPMAAAQSNAGYGGGAPMPANMPNAESTLTGGQQALNSYNRLVQAGVTSDMRQWMRGQRPGTTPEEIQMYTQLLKGNQAGESANQEGAIRNQGAANVASITGQYGMGQEALRGQFGMGQEAMRGNAQRDVAAISANSPLAIAETGRVGAQTEQLGTSNRMQQHLQKLAENITSMDPDDPRRKALINNYNFLTGQSQALRMAVLPELAKNAYMMQPNTPFGQNTFSQLTNASNGSDTGGRSVEQAAMMYVQQHGGDYNQVLKQMRGYADGGEIEGYARGGAIAVRSSSQPMMDAVTTNMPDEGGHMSPIVAEYQQYVKATQQEGGMPIPIQQYVSMKQNALLSSVQNQQMGFAEGGTVGDWMRKTFMPGTYGDHPQNTRATAIDTQVNNANAAYRPAPAPATPRSSDPTTQALLEKYKNYADGGAVDVSGRTVLGPGTGKSDSIPAIIDGQRPAALSTGEFVMPVEAVKHFGTDRLNKMVEAARKSRQTS